MPLQLKIGNGILRRHISRGVPLSEAIRLVEKQLDAKGPASLAIKDDIDLSARHRSIGTTIEASLELLDLRRRHSFAELGIFPEDADIPIEVIARLWDMSEDETFELLEECHDLSLLLDLDGDRWTVAFTTRFATIYNFLWEPTLHAPRTRNWLKECVTSAERK